MVCYVYYIDLSKGDEVLFFKRKKRGFPNGKSLSDSGDYAEFCYMASWNNEMFDCFRRAKAYTGILEHVKFEDGKRYLEEIPEVTYLNEFRKNDLYGNPEVFDYGENGFFSPTTLRYAKVFYDLKKYFGDLADFSICEIGVGYGGQCRICSSVSKIRKYTLLDIPQALSLAKRYLQYYPIKTFLAFKTLNEFSFDEKIDLVISNYAFTEIHRDLQEVYMDKIVSKAKRGYITYNEITPPEFNSFKKQELLSVIPGSFEVTETPLTHPRNCILVWGAENDILNPNKC